MVMKTENQSNVLVNLKLLLIVPVIAAVIVAVSSCGNKNHSETKNTEIAIPPRPPQPPTMIGSDTTWQQVDIMPLYPGGDEALLKFIAENIIYPNASKTKGTQGRVIVKFCVTSKGSVSSCEILKGVSEDIDAEAIRVVNSLVKFKPGIKDGKPVPVWYMVPINFALK
jgi:TonB family protein